MTVGDKGFSEDLLAASDKSVPPESCVLPAEHCSNTLTYNFTRVLPLPRPEIQIRSERKWACRQNEYRGGRWNRRSGWKSADAAVGVVNTHRHVQTVPHQVYVLRIRQKHDVGSVGEQHVLAVKREGITGMMREVIRTDEPAYYRA